MRSTARGQLARLLGGVGAWLVRLPADGASRRQVAEGPQTRAARAPPAARHPWDLSRSPRPESTSSPRGIALPPEPRSAPSPGRSDSTPPASARPHRQAPPTLTLRKLSPSFAAPRCTERIVADCRRPGAAVAALEAVAEQGVPLVGSGVGVEPGDPRRVSEIERAGRGQGRIAEVDGRRQLLQAEVSPPRGRRADRRRRERRDRRWERPTEPGSCRCRRRSSCPAAGRPRSSGRAPPPGPSGRSR